MAVDVTFGRGEGELAPGVVELRDGMEMLRADPTDDVWYSWKVVDCVGIMTFHINPKPEEIQPHWERPSAG
jgi:hypothetical protein